MKNIWYEDFEENDDKKMHPGIKGIIIGIICIIFWLLKPESGIVYILVGLGKFLWIPGFALSKKGYYERMDRKPGTIGIITNFIPFILFISVVFMVLFDIVSDVNYYDRTAETPSKQQPENAAEIEHESSFEYYDDFIEYINNTYDMIFDYEKNMYSLYMKNMYYTDPIHYDLAEYLNTINADGYKEILIAEVQKKMDDALGTEQEEELKKQVEKAGSLSNYVEIVFDSSTFETKAEKLRGLYRKKAYNYRENIVSSMKNEKKYTREEYTAFTIAGDKACDGTEAEEILKQNYNDKSLYEAFAKRKTIKYYKIMKCYELSANNQNTGAELYLYACFINGRWVFLKNSQ